jgi:hypothetical protein
MSLPLFTKPLAFEPISTWDPYVLTMIRAHYTGSRGAPVGKKQAWIVTEHGRRVGVIGLGEPSFKLAARRRLGLEDARPLPRTVSCFIARFEGHTTRAGDILRAWHPVAAQHWEGRYGWAPVHWETMVGNATEGGRTHHGGALGACFRRSGYRSLGWTTGRSARRPAGNTHGPRVWTDAEPKLVLYRGPLARLPAS